MLANLPHHSATLQSHTNDLHIFNIHEFADPEGGAIPLPPPALLEILAFLCFSQIFENLVLVFSKGAFVTP